MRAVSGSTASEPRSRQKEREVWEKTTLREVTRHHSGNSKLIKGKLFSSPEDGLFPAYSASGQDVWRDAFEHEGDAVVVSAVGARCGKCFLASGKWSAIANTHVVWPNSESIDIKFLWYRINDERFWERSGSAQPFVVVRKTFEREFHLPSLTAQQRIVAEIEKQFTRLEAGLAGLRRVQANLKRYRAAVLKAACEGALTDTDVKSWKRAKLGDVLTAIEAGKSFRCEERPPSQTEVGIVKVSAVTWGRYNEKESKTCLDSSRVEERFLVHQGDFLFSRANTIELVGACVIAKQISLRVMLSDKILRFRFSRDVLPEWVLYWLRSLVGRHEIERLATGNQMSMRNIGQERIRQIRLLVPPIAEQSFIVSEVERRLSIVDELEAVVATNIQRANRLRQSILQQAFKGELIS